MLAHCAAEELRELARDHAGSAAAALQAARLAQTADEAFENGILAVRLGPPNKARLEEKKQGDRRTRIAAALGPDYGTNIVGKGNL